MPGKQIPIYQTVLFLNVGATIGRPHGFVKQNRIAARRLSIISFGNPNICDTNIGRATNGRPYSVVR